LGSDVTSQIVTLEQSMQNTSYFEKLWVVIKTGKTFTKKYGALDFIIFDVFTSNKYAIPEWVTDKTFQLSISYGLVAKDGEIVKSIIINQYPNSKKININKFKLSFLVINPIYFTLRVQLEYYNRFYESIVKRTGGI
jgi:hypothetical protein